MSVVSTRFSFPNLMSFFFSSAENLVCFQRIELLKQRLDPSYQRHALLNVSSVQRTGSQTQKSKLTALRQSDVIKNFPEEEHSPADTVTNGSPSARPQQSQQLQQQQQQNEMPALTLPPRSTRGRSVQPESAHSIQSADECDEIPNATPPSHMARLPSLSMPSGPAALYLQQSQRSLHKEQQQPLESDQLQPSPAGNMDLRDFTALCEIFLDFIADDAPTPVNLNGALIGSVRRTFATLQQHPIQSPQNPQVSHNRGSVSRVAPLPHSAVPSASPIRSAHRSLSELRQVSQSNLDVQSCELATRLSQHPDCDRIVQEVLTLYTRVQDNLFHLMCNDSYPRFVRSKEFQAAAQNIKLPAIMESSGTSNHHTTNELSTRSRNSQIPAV